MNMKKQGEGSIPLTVPQKSHKKYIENVQQATQNSGNLFLFAGDQKIEHLNEDFYGPSIAEDDNQPKHLFDIASKARIGVFATQLGLIAQYGMHYDNINYLIKLNSKTNLIPTSQKDPQSLLLHSVNDVVEFQQSSKLPIVGVGYTVYLGSKYESLMLKEAAQTVLKAHQYGFLVVLWMYPRGKVVTDKQSPNLIAGAAGVSVCLGADFVKVNPPKATTSEESAKYLKQATLAAGTTRVICSGGKIKDEEAFLQELHDQIHIGGTAGNATGRNIHQKPLEKAIKFCNAIAAIVIDNKDVQTAQKLLR